MPTERERGVRNRIRLLSLLSALPSLLTGFGSQVWDVAGPHMQRTASVICTVESAVNLARIGLCRRVAVTGVMRAEGLADLD